MTGYEALRSDAAWLDLSARGRIRLTGEDRARLLHAMSTNHVKELADGKGLYAFFLSAQGRILADASVYNFGEALLLDTEPELRSKLFEHLDKYIIADDVEMEDETDKTVCFAIEGPNAGPRAEALGFTVPADAYGVAPFGDGWTVRVASVAVDGVRIIVPHVRKEEVLKLLQLPEAGPEDAEIVRLENGIPRYGQDITERYLVQETQVLRAVHFNKGCYLGQEIVERVRSRAQVHRHLLPIRISGQTVPATGTKLTANGSSVGEITSARFSPALGNVAALAYVRSEAEQARSPMGVEGFGPEAAATLA